MKYLNFTLILLLTSVTLFGQQKEVVEGNNAFGIKLSQQLNDRPDFIFSPFSISSALAMMQIGSNNETKKQMNKALCFPVSDYTLHQGFSELSKTLNNSETDVAVANKIWVDQNRVSLYPEFLRVNKENYGATPENVNFSDKAGSVKTINDWADKHTNGLIKEIVTPPMISPGLITIVTNAIYFNGKWQKPFEKKDTYVGDFFNEKKVPSPTDFLKQKGSYFVCESEIAEEIIIPYKKMEYLFHLIIPKTAIDEVINNYSKLNIGKNFFTNPNIKRLSLNLHFPKFKLTTNEKINNQLIELGMVNAFDNGADFSKMGSASGPIYIDFVQHKAFIDVSEEGTKAAAVTAVGSVSRSMEPDYVKKVVNHPFLFAITHQSTGAILFMGKISNPTYKD